jgi:outer membrane protein assembly factor BamB
MIPPVPAGVIRRFSGALNTIRRALQNLDVKVHITDRSYSYLDSTENNGTRMYRFTQDGQADPQPAATHAELNPDTQSPVIIGGRLFGAVGRLYCLDLDQGLKTRWTGDDKSLLGQVSLIAGKKHLLIGTESGELLLDDGRADRFQVISRLSPWADKTGLSSHPTLVDRVLYLRGSNEIISLSLEP